MSAPYRLLIGSDQVGAAYKTAIARDLAEDSRVSGVQDISERSILSNDCQVLALGQRVIGLADGLRAASITEAVLRSSADQQWTSVVSASGLDS